MQHGSGNGFQTMSLCLGPPVPIIGSLKPLRPPLAQRALCGPGFTFLRLIVILMERR
jgi:hypothetical protein